MYLIITFYLNEFHGENFMVFKIHIHHIQCHVSSFHLITLHESVGVSTGPGHKNEDMTKISYLL